MSEPIKTEKNPAAVALGRLGRGKPKTLTEAQRETLAARMRELHKAKANAAAQGSGVQNSPLPAIEGEGKLNT